MSNTFDIRKLESLENFMSLKRGISNLEVIELENLLYPGGATRVISPLDIENLELSLNVIAPNEYRKFLLEYGYASWFGGAVYGITPENCVDPSLDLSVLKLTKQVRSLKDESIRPFVHHSWIIGKDDAGGYLVLASADDDPNGSVRLLVHENEWLIAASWPSFFDRLAEQYRHNKKN